MTSTVIRRNGKVVVRRLLTLHAHGAELPGYVIRGRSMRSTLEVAIVEQARSQFAIVD